MAVSLPAPAGWLDVLLVPARVWPQVRVLGSGDHAALNDLRCAGSNPRRGTRNMGTGGASAGGGQLVIQAVVQFKR